jgi:hypothetical protein
MAVPVVPGKVGLPLEGGLRTTDKEPVLSGRL